LDFEKKRIKRRLNSFIGHLTTPVSNNESQYRK